MVSNVAIEQDAAGNLKPSKRRSAEKIDGVVALIMALGRAIVAAERKDSIYEKQGLDYV
jgi:phage terminase large subunit-like protein